MPTSWTDLVEDAPDLAAAVRARFSENTHHLLATIRADGSPRLSGSEVVIDADNVGLGMMPGSLKLADVIRDPRVEIHSAPLDEKLARGDAKISGLLISAGNVDLGPGSAFVLDIQRVSLVRVDGKDLLFEIWTPGHGWSQKRRR